MDRFIAVIPVLMLAVLGPYGSADAYSTGSPRCDLASMLAMSPSPDRNPNINWSLDVVPERDVSKDFTSPDLFRVSIVSSEPGYTFKGFLLYAENSNGTRVGQWLNVSESRARFVLHPECSGGSTLTQFDSDDKSSGLVFHYRVPVPTHQNDTIKIHCGIVCTVNEWYLARPVILRPNMAAAVQYRNLTSPSAAVHDINQTITPAPIPPKL